MRNDCSDLALEVHLGHLAQRVDKLLMRSPAIDHPRIVVADAIGRHGGGCAAYGSGGRGAGSRGCCGLVNVGLEALEELVGVLWCIKGELRNKKGERKLLVADIVDKRRPGR